ncbi:MAG: alkaline phosphatase family protein, partial [Anaerolineae bacterium]|nr:alkaline phosphatase family protein [Anaerolineae bacterium]
MSKWSPRVLVIGWDGADWRILRPLMRAGYMPNLTALVERSAVGDLLSTQPAVTGPAWSSFMTGKSPARHGLLSWQRPLNASLERPWVNASELQGP